MKESETYHIVSGFFTESNQIITGKGRNSIKKMVKLLEDSLSFKLRCVTIQEERQLIKTTQIKNGMVKGIAAADPRIVAYKGIPYAAPPIGRFRWRAPQPCENWEGIRECYTFAPISMQNIPGMDTDNIYTNEWNVDPEIPMSEDSLYLNVWTNAKSVHDRLPVYVFYHGGGFQWGNTAEMEFDGERIARRGIVVVTIAYRLNVFGFLAHPLLREEDTQTTFNFGLLDQEFGLKWVKDNIAAFGGNPDHIVIGGQSAGGGSVVSLLARPENREYIQGAVVESGVFSDPFVKMFSATFDEAVEQSKDFFAYLGVDTLEEARAIPAEQLRDQNEAYGKLWFPIIDGSFQKDYYWNQIKSHQFLDVPILTGWNSNEFITGSQNDTFCSVELGERQLCRWRQENSYLSEHYVYQFGPFIPGKDQPGAFHSSELWFFFETLAKCSRAFTGEHYDLSRKMCDYLCNFIRTGNPNGNDMNEVSLPEWKAFDSERPMTMGFFDKAMQRVSPMADNMKPYIDWTEEQRQVSIN